MASADLLPSNSTALERAMVEAGSLHNIDPDVIRTLWSADECPVQFLPWLAWSLSVDFWELAISEAQQRDLIRNAIQWHRKRGTPWAIKQSIAAFGMDRVELDEHPPGAHWAEFDVGITIVDRPLSKALYAQIERLIEVYKAGRSHLRRMVVSVATHGALHVGCVTLGGDTVTILPYPITELVAPQMIGLAGIGGHDWGTTTIYPRPS